MKKPEFVRVQLTEEAVSASAMYVAREYDKASVYTKNIINYILEQEQKKREAQRNRDEYFAEDDQILE